MNKRLNISSGTAWEEIVGYSRAVRVGQVIEVAGTTAVDETGQVVGNGDPYQQARYALSKIEKALRAAGGSLDDVVRTRTFVTDMTHWQEVGRAHGECFRNIKPVATMVAVKALISPELLVEIEVTVIVTD
jgi:enamine deaminase RidA (YjgF/YER057c/UK114 family)